MTKLIYLEGSLIGCGQISIESCYTLFYWTYSIVWCEVKYKALSLIYDGWILTINNIRLGLLSTPHVGQNPRSHPFQSLWWLALSKAILKGGVWRGRFVWAVYRVCTCVSIAIHNLSRFAQGIWKYIPKAYGIDYVWSTI